jgi:hypothetical protein
MFTKNSPTLYSDLTPDSYSIALKHIRLGECDSDLSLHSDLRLGWADMQSHCHSKSYLGGIHEVSDLDCKYAADYICKLSLFSRFPI